MKRVTVKHVLLIVIIAVVYTFSHSVFAKSKRTLINDEELNYARELVQKANWAKEHVEILRESIQWIMAMSDEEVWNYIPDADLPRAYNVHFGADCPIHGNEINRKGGHYPWISSRELPFKIKCPVGGEIYPSNDFAGWYKEGRRRKA